MTGKTSRVDNGFNSHCSKARARMADLKTQFCLAKSKKKFQVNFAVKPVDDGNKTGSTGPGDTEST